MTPIVPNHIRSVIDANGAVLLDLKRGAYFSLNGIAAEIWQALERGRSIVEIEEDLSSVYDVPRDKLRRDLRHLVAALAEASLLVSRP